MRINNSYSKLTLILTAAILTEVMTGCIDKQDNQPLNQEVAVINDTLRAGHLDSAIRMTDKLKKKSIAAGDSATWSEAMVQQGVNSYYQGNPTLLIASTDSAIKWLERQKPSRERARVLARAYQTHGAYFDQYNFNADSTAKYMRKSVDNAEKSGIRTDLPQAYSNYANAMRMGASLDSAAIYYHKAISIADSLELDTSHYIPLYNGIAAVFTDMRDFDNSEIWWKKSMEIIGSMNQFDKFNTLSGYGNDLYYRKNYHEAERVFLRLRKMLDSVPDSRWEKMFTDVNLADTYIRLGRTPEATVLLDTTANYFSNEQLNPVVLSYIHTLQMRAAIADKNFNVALQLAQRYPETDTLRLEQHLARLKALEEVYSQTGDKAQAYVFRSRYDHLNDSLRSYELNQQISAINAIYQRDHRILNLEAGNTRQKAHIYMLLAAVAFSIAVIIGLILVFLIRRINSHRREERMMNKIISLRQENLRNRITPHFIYNTLNHELHNKNQGKPSHLDSLVRLIRRQQLVVSEILIPFSEELKFVDDCINVMSDDGRGDINYRYTIDPDIDPNFLFPSMALQILVENAFKHGFKTLDPDEERRLDISVRDSGNGKIAVTVFNNCNCKESHISNTGTGLRVLVETIRLINDRHRETIEFTHNANSELDGMRGYTAVITLSPYINNEKRQ